MRHRARRCRQEANKQPLRPTGHIRQAHIKIRALEDVLKEAKPVHYERYRQLARQYEIESAPEAAFPLEDIEELRKALLRRD
jgi:hypothetical protein